MEIGTVIHGFMPVKSKRLDELDGELWELVHVKTEARLCWLNREDENKTFSIAFRTLPEDSTGVFHILEHSVLSGSDKYPVKEPFVELMKTSVKTFLNAMTFPDKTVFPVSSRNDQDLLNLMDVYLDAVFHPSVCRKPEIFLQEGWHYEPGEKTVYQGVVLNEMKGAFGSPYTVLEVAMNRLLFPDNCFRHVCGGDPEHIVDLTYEQLLRAYDTFYHPSNAFISLAGSVDMEAVLSKLDGFLREFDRRQISFEIPMQKPVPAVTETVPYEVGPDESISGKTIVSCGTLLGDYSTRQRNWAALILSDYLAGGSDAPLKRAILDAGLGQDASVTVHTGLQQTWISWDVWNTDAEKLPALRKMIRETLEKIVTDGLDSQRLRASCRRFAFQMRDRDSSGYPRSLNEALSMLDTWPYGGDPAEGLLVEDILNDLTVQPDPCLFAGLIRELLLDDNHSVTAVLVPSPTLTEEKAEKEAARIARESAAWSEEHLAQLKQQAVKLAEWQKTPDSKEALAAIPVLSLSDLKEKPEPLPMSVTPYKDNVVLRHRTSDNLLYLHAYFNADDLTAEQLPVLSALARVLGVMETSRRSGRDLQMLVKEQTGRLSFQPVIYPGSDVGHCRVRLFVSASCLKEQGEDAAELLREILTETRFTDRRLLRDLLNQASMEMQMSLASQGQMYAVTRAAACHSAHGAAREYAGGMKMAAWLKRMSTAEDSVLDELLASMAHVAGKVFTQPRLTLSCSENVSDAILERLTFPDGDNAPAEACFMPMDIRQEGIVIPAAVGFAARCANLRRHGMGYSGSIPVLASILNFSYLWNNIRVQGGAYGCGFIGRDDGDIGCFTYRDPQPGRSLDVMNGAAGFIRDFCAGKPDLSGFILSSVNALDPLLSTEQRMVMAENRFFKGICYENICRLYSQLVHTSQEDILELCDVLDCISDDNTVCVAASKSLLDACGIRLSSRITA